MTVRRISSWINDDGDDIDVEGEGATDDALLPCAAFRAMNEMHLLVLLLSCLFCLHHVVGVELQEQVRHQPDPTRFRFFLFFVVEFF